MNHIYMPNEWRGIHNMCVCIYICQMRGTQIVKDAHIYAKCSETQLKKKKGEAAKGLNRR